jgi:hypothetical protein
MLAMDMLVKFRHILLPRTYTPALHRDWHADGHNAYLLANSALAAKLVALRVVGDDDESVWQFSDSHP